MNESQHNLVKVSSRSSVSKRTRLEIGLIAAVVLLVILLLIFFILTIVLAEENKKLEIENRPKICNSTECIRSAYSLIESMDRTVDPCENFYKFACGNFRKAHPVEDNEMDRTWFSDVQDQINRQIKEILDEDRKYNTTEPYAVFAVTSLYKSCIDTEKLDEIGLKPIMKFLDYVKLPKQIPNSETAAYWDITTTLSLIKKYTGMDILLKIFIDMDTDLNKFMLYLKTPPEEPTLMTSEISVVKNRLRIPKSSLVSDSKELLIRLAYMTLVLQKLETWYKNSTVSNKTYATVAVKILVFASNIKDAFDHTTRNSTTTNVKIPIPVLQSIMDSSIQGAKFTHKINLEKYMKLIMDDLESEYDIEKDDIHVTDIIYYQNLAWLLANSQIETIQRYVWWQVVGALTIYTDSAMRNLYKQMEESLYGASSISSSSRWETCLQQTKSLMPLPLNYMMGKKHDLTNTVSKVKSMLNNIRDSFKSLVNEDDWMDSDTKRAAKEKADAIIFYIGYQDWIFEQGKLDEYYGNLEVEEDEYLWNIFAIKNASLDRELTYLGAPFVNTRNLRRYGLVLFIRVCYGMNGEFFVGLYENLGSLVVKAWAEMDVLDAGAFYSPVENCIEILAGILQFPFYGKGLESLNYGAIGAVLGHELTHGFDSSGKDYTKDGVNEPWWSDEMSEKYTNLTQCFIHQYSNYAIGRYKVNGETTLGENIADNGGVRETYRAYQKYVAANGPEPGLPGLEEFSSEQLLFLSFANMWCVDEGSTYFLRIFFDEHSPAQFRVLGSLSNSPEFSETWKCPANSTMNNAQNRCTLW